MLHLSLCILLQLSLCLTFLIYLRTVMTVWKTVLDETDRVGRMRLQAADAYHHEIYEACKPLKTQKAQMAKKVSYDITLMLQSGCEYGDGMDCVTWADNLEVTLSAPGSFRGCYGDATRFIAG